MPDLIEALTVQRQKRIEMPVERYVLGWSQVFTGYTSTGWNGVTMAVSAPSVGVG